MIKIAVETRQAVMEETELITTGSVGIQVQFQFSEDWEGLTRVAVFRAGDSSDWYDMILDETNICVIPWEILTAEFEGEPVFIGVEGTDRQTNKVVVPTIWISAGAVKPGVHSGNAESADPTPSQWSQIRDLAAQAEASAEAAQAAASHQPIVSGDMWYVWDIDQGTYVNTNVRATPSISAGTVTTLNPGEPATVVNSGTENIAVFDFGIPKGDQGVSIQSVTKASGTGEPGTTDTYDVNLDNGTVAGQFTVYNGSGVTVDTEMSPTSTNPVQNKVICEELDDLQGDILANFAANYNASTSYTIGKYCIHEGKLYRCIVTIPSPGETWTPSHWASVNISNQVYNTIIKISNQYNPARTYKKDEVCIYGDALKYCKIDMTQPEEWNFSHWGTVTGVMDVVGSGQLDSSFTADNLTGAANELKNTLNQLDSEKADEDSLALRRSGATNTGAQIENGTYFYLDGTLKHAIAAIAENAPFTNSNCETVPAGGLNELNNKTTPSDLSIAATGDITRQSFYVKKIGATVYVAWQGRTVSGVNIQAGSVLASGLPTPIINLINIPAFSDSGLRSVCYIMGDKLYNRTAITGADDWYMTFSYLTSD